MKFGFDNPTMEMEPPKSPWRYPHRTFSAPMRSESRKSTKSVGFRDDRVVHSFGPKLLHPASAHGAAALAAQIEALNVESVPDVHHNAGGPSAESASQGGSVSRKSGSRSSLSHSSSSHSSSSHSSSSSSSSEDEGELERVRDVATPTAASTDFQSQFRRPLGSRQNSRASTSASASASASPAASGASTPKRRISGEDDIQLDRSDSSYRRNGSSGLAVISSRISAAVDADRSSRYAVAIPFRQCGPVLEPISVLEFFFEFFFEWRHYSTRSPSFSETRAALPFYETRSSPFSSASSPTLKTDLDAQFNSA